MNFRVRRDYSAVPVLMFHSIGMTDLPWVWSDMSEEVGVFEGVLDGLANDGYIAVGLEDLYAYMSGNKTLPEKPVVLTFDDGYLDNWVHAVPLLRKYEMRATVYVTPEFVPDSEILRPVRSDNDAIPDKGNKHEVAGFMNWAELRAADTEGILDVQSHALTHTWYFSGPRILDFHRPAEVYRYPWLSWNAAPDRKPHYLTENQQLLVPWGHPILEHEKSLVVHRFTPEQAVVDEICRFVRDQGGVTFFEDNEWKKMLAERVSQHGAHNQVPGSYETETEYLARVKHELSRSREIIESRLKKKVEFLAWPGGGVNDAAAGLARAAGYKSWTLSSWQQPDRRNRPGTEPEGIKRVTGRSKVFARGRWIANGGAWWVLHRLRSHQGSLGSKLATTAMKLKWLTVGGQAVRRNRA